MSIVTRQPEALTLAGGRLRGIGSSMSSHHTAAASPGDRRGFGGC